MRRRVDANVDSIAAIWACSRSAPSILPPSPGDYLPRHQVEQLAVRACGPSNCFPRRPATPRRPIHSTTSLAVLHVHMN